MVANPSSAFSISFITGEDLFSEVVLASNEGIPLVR